VVLDANGTAARMIGVNADITEQKNAENALKSNIAKLEVLLGITSLPEANVQTISDHILSSITKLLESAYGFYGFVSEDQSIMTIHSWSGEAMENCSMVDKPSDFAICKSGIWAEAVRRREPLILNNYAANHPAKRGLPAGHVQLTKLLVVPFFSHGRITAVAAVANRNSDYSQDDVAQLTAFLTSVQAITDSKQTEAELRKSEGHFRTLVQTIPDLIWLKDKDGVYLSCNPKFERFFGAKVADIVGKTDYDFVDREVANFFVENDRKAMLEGKPTSNEEWITFADDGHRVLLETIKTPMCDSQGTLIGVLGIGRDITERRRAEEENAQLQVQLQQAQKMEAIGTLAGGIAHDFNNILGAILGYAELAQEDSPAGSMMRKDIDQVVKASHRAKDLVKQILAFSRQAATDHIPLQPGIIIKEALKMLRSSLPTTIDIRQDIDPEAGLILADPTQIHQVIVNLCTNAFHAMEETGGILNISLKKTTLTKPDLANEPHVQPGDFIQLSIGDTGPGIAPEIREKIFDPYFTTKAVGKGTGMGLAIIHGIVKSYNGFVSCHSRPGEGTVFHVYLPVISDSVVPEPETLSLDLPQLGNERILFIDDEDILAEMGKVMLERLGYRVTVRNNSLEALNTFQNQPEQFDLVISDQTMPDMTGIDLARRMLQIRPGMPIILCTGYSSLISEDKAKSLGIKGFALKPLAKKDIAAIIRKVLDEVP
jgi:PAS domain S-box-containing protein